ncbi:ABC transporter permease [Paenibacillus radicis (ex Xue et al. 2023)]|uniref:ABC transporter permease subunit n=1 Tax=Paenibacillus radicis (ex Xue et al. 2023) TaxID=2972489 RepID=A0ABT1YCN0_9BACL|nr:ABC transporter permease subunit [Paenibacillus radicis (ex Xue et al. 2023)]MCR8629968.1 ABC transporter permease subunit [Paenibacillus radicis (ex Xue et al. 2023)]
MLNQAKTQLHPSANVPASANSRLKKLKKIRENWQLYSLLLIPFVYVIVFHYVPMTGLVIAFKNYNVVQGVFNSKWVGLAHFQRFFNSYDFWNVLKNTLTLSVYNLVVGFPAPIILALCINYLPSKRFKKLLQMTTYAPHFISIVVIAGIIVQLLSREGLVNTMIVALGGERINFLGTPEYFKSIYVFSGVWQQAGWGSIIYLAALSGIDPQLHEAARMDGANKLRRIWHIDIPGILPTIVILLIMDVGRIMNIGFQKVLLLQNPLNVSTSEVIDTYVYKVGIISGMPNFSYAAAIGLFKSIIGVILIIAVNRIARKVNDTSLW